LELPVAEGAESERVGMIRVVLSVIAVAAEEEVLPHLDRVDAPEPVDSVQQDGDEAGCTAVRGHDGPVAELDRAEGARGLEAPQALEGLEGGEGIAAAHAAGALGEELETRVPGQVAQHAQERLDRFQRVARRRVAPASLFGHPGLRVARAEGCDVGQRDRRARPAAQESGLLHERRTTGVCLGEPDVAANGAQHHEVAQVMDDVHHRHAGGPVGHVGGQLIFGHAPEQGVWQDALEGVGCLDPGLPPKRVQQDEQSARRRTLADAALLEDLGSEHVDARRLERHRHHVQLDPEILQHPARLSLEGPAEVAERARGVCHASRESRERHVRRVRSDPLLRGLRRRPNGRPFAPHGVPGEHTREHDEGP
jgi:hypothetical protein